MPALPWGPSKMVLFKITTSVVFACSGCHNKMSQAGGYRNLVSYSLGWRLEVQDQNAHRFVFFLQPLSLTCRCHFSCCILTCAFPRTCTCPMFPWMSKFPLLTRRTPVAWNRTYPKDLILTQSQL